MIRSKKATDICHRRSPFRVERQTFAEQFTVLDKAACNSVSNDQWNCLSTILNAFIVRYLSEYAIGHLVSSDWTELYRPKCLDDIVGNPKAVEDLRRWADSWDAGKPSKKAAVLIGTPGTGKTSAALALGKDRDWNVVEMNASDQRNADSIACVATRGAMGDTFTEDGRYLSKKEGHLKLIILDEADNISGQEDKGGIPAIVDLVRTTKQPIILIVNDYYALTKKSAVLKTQTEQIKFSRLKPVTVRGVLRKIAKDQNVKISDRALEVLAENSNGDLRSAVRDLQAVALGKEAITEENAAVVGCREVERTMYGVLDDVLMKKIRRMQGLISRMSMRPPILNYYGSRRTYRSLTRSP